MGLEEVLRQRTAVTARTAEVSCGELGRLTVEALPQREWQQLAHGADGARAVFFAACRALQAEGEVLRSQGRLFRPDEIMQFITDGEAEEAARVVGQLSAHSESRPEFVQPDRGNFPEVRHGSVQNFDRPDGEFRPASVQAFRGGIRLSSVQRFLGEVRHGSVQKNRTENPEIRHGFVQALRGLLTGGKAGISADGQVSREFLPGKAGTTDVFGVAEHGQGLVVTGAQGTQALDAGQASTGGDDVIISGKGSRKPETGWQNGNFRRTFNGNALHEIKSGIGEKLHEIASEVSGQPHEIESEMQGADPVGMHETKSYFGRGLHERKSYFREKLHETASEFPEDGPEGVHETKSYFRKEVHEAASEFPAVGSDTVHEIESEIEKPVHEIESEIRERDAQALHEIKSGMGRSVHETESEAAQRLAWALLEGLRAAAAVQ